MKPYKVILIIALLIVGWYFIVSEIAEDTFSNLRMAIGGKTVETMDLNDTAKALSRKYSDDEQFVRAVYLHTLWKIKYERNVGFNVKNPYKAWADGIGDCSERALVMVEIMKVRNIDARIIHGVIPGLGNHDTVEIHMNKKVWVIDQEMYPTFAKTGDGLTTGSYIV